MTEENKKTEEKKNAEAGASENKEIVNEKTNELKNEVKVSEPTKKTLKEKVQEKKEEKENKKVDKKKAKSKPVGPKKTEAVVNGKSLAISTKTSTAVCKFIKGKNIQRAISDLEQVLVHKKVVPMKGEIAHQKGKGIYSGGYPKKAAERFILLLKSLQTNANVGGLENPVIVEAIANMASRPYGRFGRVKKKRTHVKIKAKEKKDGRKKRS